MLRLLEPVSLPPRLTDLQSEISILSNECTLTPEDDIDLIIRRMERADRRLTTVRYGLKLVRSAAIVEKRRRAKAVQA